MFQNVYNFFKCMVSAIFNIFITLQESFFLYLCPFLSDMIYISLLKKIKQSTDFLNASQSEKIKFKFYLVYIADILL